jgi:phage protein D
MNHLTPSYNVIVNGKSINPQINGRLIRLSITDNRGDKADQFDLELTDHDGALELPPTGAKAELWLGFKEDDVLTFKGSYIIDEIEYSDQGGVDCLTVRGRSANLRGPLRVKKEQSWHEITLNEIISTIAKRNTLIPTVSEALGKHHFNHIDQTDESDISFVNRLAKRLDALATVKADRLLFTPKGEAKTVSGSPLPAIKINREETESFSFRIEDRDNEYTGVKTQWNNKKYAKRHTEIAGTKEELLTLRHTFQNQAEAKAAAWSKWREIQRGKVSLTLNLAQGNPRIFPEMPVQLVGFKAQVMEHDWLITQVNHTLTDSGYYVNLPLEVANGDLK